MTLSLVLLALALLLASALGTVLVRRSKGIALQLGTWGCVGAALLGAGSSFSALVREDVTSLRTAWSFAVGGLHVGLDALSAFFLLCLFAVSALAAWYGAGYLRGFAGKHPGPPSAFFNLLVAAMAGLVIARDGVLFLICWELMSFASFFLVTFENEREEVRRAGMTYLIASHLGAVFLFVLFVLLSRRSGNFDFDSFRAAGAPGAGLANVCFLLGLIGFGTKAGLWPVHVWLPDAHPAAPSHVSALMSGVMIKMGVYGLLRVFTFLGHPQEWWGTALILVGAVSGIAGMVHALAQHDLKRTLAYSSIENVGIVALGLGLGLIGQSRGIPSVAFLGYAGALLHVLNHGLMKGLLFQAAGSILHGAGTGIVDSLGGLYRRMPVTGLLFFIGSLAICGLPPLNGFIGEWFIYLGSLEGSADLPKASAISAIAIVPSLALIGGLACACFVKTFGAVFLGEARSNAVGRAHEASKLMLAPMIVGGVTCVALGLWPQSALRLVAPVVHSTIGASQASFEVGGSLHRIVIIALVLLALVAALWGLRRALLSRRERKTQTTWGCGYVSPNARMQYTSASFAGPLIEPFSPLLHTEVHREGPEGYFPTRASYDEHVRDVAGERLLMPATHRFVETVSKLKVIQQGRIHLYLVYVLVTLVVLLVWQLAGASGN